MARTIFAQEPQAYNRALAAAIKKIPQFKAPEWAMFVKSGVAKQRVPQDDDFWYVRTASILRQLYVHGVVGVSRIKTRYGSRKNRGKRPDKFRKASGKIIRTILQQAEAAELVEKVLVRQFGRRLTQKGRDFLDSITVEKPVDRTAEMVEVKKLIEKEKEFIQQIGQEAEQAAPVEQSGPAVEEEKEKPAAEKPAKEKKQEKSKSKTKPAEEEKPAAEKPVEEVKNAK